MDRIELAITKVLRELEIPVHFRGYPFIKDAVALLLEDGNLLYHITKPGGLYDHIATKRGVSISKVERGIRNALEQSTADKVTRKLIFGRADHATNTEALGAIVEYLRMMEGDASEQEIGADTAAKGQGPTGTSKPSAARRLYYPQV